MSLKIQFLKVGGNLKAFEDLCYFREHFLDKVFELKKSGEFNLIRSIENKRFAVIQDFTKPSSQMRFFLLDFELEIVETYFSAHGKGKDTLVNSPLLANFFSNEHESLLTPSGFLITSERVPSKKAWKWHMKLDGLQENINDNSRDRYIVFHAAVHPEDQYNTIVQRGFHNSAMDFCNHDGEILPQGMTSGCTALNPDHIDEIYERMKNGAILYNFTQRERDLEIKDNLKSLLIKGT